MCLNTLRILKNSNLNSINFFKKKFRIEVDFRSFSDIEVPIASAAMGVTVIEKHFTLSKKMKGPDHKASLEPKRIQINGLKNKKY